MVARLRWAGAHNKDLQYGVCRIKEQYLEPTDSSQPKVSSLITAVVKQRRKSSTNQPTNQPMSFGPMTH